MPKLLVDFITSLDGYAGGGWPGFWGSPGARVPGLARRTTRGHIPYGSEHLPTDVGLRRRRNPTGNRRVHCRRGGFRRRTHASVEGVSPLSRSRSRGPTPRWCERTQSKRSGR